MTNRRRGGREGRREGRKEGGRGEGRARTHQGVGTGGGGRGLFEADVHLLLPAAVGVMVVVNKEGKEGRECELHIKVGVYPLLSSSLYMHATSASPPKWNSPANGIGAFFHLTTPPSLPPSLPPYMVSVVKVASTGETGISSSAAITAGAAASEAGAALAEEEEVEGESVVVALAAAFLFLEGERKPMPDGLSGWVGRAWLCRVHFGGGREGGREEGRSVRAGKGTNVGEAGRQADKKAPRTSVA